MRSGHITICSGHTSTMSILYAKDNAKVVHGRKALSCVGNSVRKLSADLVNALVGGVDSQMKCVLDLSLTVRGQTPPSFRGVSSVQLSAVAVFDLVMTRDGQNGKI